MTVNLYVKSSVEVIKFRCMQETRTFDNKLIFWIIVCLLLAIIPWFV